MDPNPVVMLVMSLLTPPAVADDLNRVHKPASAYGDLFAVLRPVGCNLIRRDGNSDKVDRTSQGFASGSDPAR